MMKKRNRILLMILAVICIVVAIMCTYYLFDKKSQTEVVIQEEKKEKSMEGVISFVDGTHITVDDKQFDISISNDPFYVSDQVKIVYMPASEEWLPIVSITLLSRDDEQIAVSNLMKNMSLEEKVAQMFMVRCPSDNALESIDQYQMGGYILFDDRIQPYTRDQFIANNADFQQLAKIPMLIGLDEEGGSVNRLSWYSNYRDVPFASPRDLYNAGGFDLIRSDTQEKATFLKSVGVNVNFAPVADLSFDANDFMYARAFGRSVEETCEYIKVVINEMKTNHLGNVLKHFPGYGNNNDTHTGSAYDQRALSEFEQNDFLPFQAGIQAGADSVLVNHNVIEQIDANAPASLSKPVHDILRNELNFKGVIFTDDLIMQAITDQYGDDLSAVLAVQAGNDMLISSDFNVQIQSVINAVQNGTISESRINESVERILRWKYRLGLFS